MKQLVNDQNTDNKNTTNILYSIIMLIKVSECLKYNYIYYNHNYSEIIIF